MKTKVIKMLLIFSFIILFIPILNVKAEELTTSDVLSFMQENNLLDEEENFSLFGRILNGNDEYDIDKFTYTIESTDDKATIKVSLNDKEKGSIEKETIINLTPNQISYTNPNEIDSLESRIDTILFTQIIYSIGGARGYNKDILINWMNQINLNQEDAGLTSQTEQIKYSYKVNDGLYNYFVNVPKSYTIDINELTDNIPVTDYISIKEIKKDVSSITLSVYSENHLNDECDIYRLNDQNQYEKVGTTSCNNGEFTDKNLKDNTTYTYQATIKDEINCSDTKTITTDEIPLTGTTICLSILGGLIILGLILVILSKKYNLFKKV